MTDHPTSAVDPAASDPDNRVVHARVSSPLFGYLIAGVCIVVVLSGIGASKGVVFGPIITDGAFFLFPLAYVLGDVITEVYGVRNARRAITAGFAANVLAVLTYQMIIVLPGFTDDFGVAKQAAIENALGPVWQIVLASVVGYVCGQSTNSFIMWLGKKRHKERRLYARLASSTGVGELVDTILFCTIAAPVIGLNGVGQWANYTAVGYFYKIVVQYLLMPLTGRFIKWLKKREPSYQEALAAASSAPLI